MLLYTNGTATLRTVAALMSHIKNTTLLEFYPDIYFFKFIQNALKSFYTYTPTYFKISL